MAAPIIDALRTRSDLKESVLHTATEFAHRASIYGVVRQSYSYMAKKCHCCRQTVINHVKVLEDKRILRHRTFRVKGTPFCEINVYTFILPRRKDTAQMCNSQNSVQKFPEQEEREKFGSIRDEITNQQKALHRFCNPGSPAYEAACARIASLTALLEDSHEKISLCSADE